MGDREIERKSPRARRVRRWEQLEARLFLHAGHLHEETGISLPPALSDAADLVAAVSATSGTALASNNANLVVPAYSSLPTATATLYLDFNGHFEASWGAYANIDTPAYSQDSDGATFSAGELASIQSIWRQVAEDYAPFNINVTTVEPGLFANGMALRVAIGGNGAWYGGSAGGVSYLNSFTSSTSNVAYVFPANLANGTARYVADAASHESGHAFGLNHQSQYNTSGVKVAEYYAGSGDGRAPLMGNSYSATRGLWWYGTTTSASTYQDDMAVISRSTNGFGYRPDEAGNTTAAAAPLLLSGTQVSASGVITTTSDVDYWSFTTGAGAISLSVAVAAGVNNLDARAQLVDSGGNVLVGWQDPTTSFGATITTSVPAGSYRLVVGSHNSYGDVGQYTVSGTIVAPLNYIAAPASLTATAVSKSQIQLTWTDQASNETGYQVERSLNGSTWVVVATLGANSTGYLNSGLAANTTYQYRVRAVNGSANSEYSNLASATTLADVPAAPGNLTWTVAGKKNAILSWTDNSSNETGFKVQRSTNGTSWTTLTTLATNSTAYTTSRPSSGTYYFRIVATSPAGDSAPSNTATVGPSSPSRGARGARSALSLAATSGPLELNTASSAAVLFVSRPPQATFASTVCNGESSLLAETSADPSDVLSDHLQETSLEMLTDTTAVTCLADTHSAHHAVEIAFEILGTLPDSQLPDSLAHDWWLSGV